MRFTVPSRRTACVVLASTALLLPAAQAAQADPGDPVPSRQDVASAKAAAGAKQRDVAAIQAALSRSNAELDATGAKAEMAAERYNAARWQLGEAVRAQRSSAAKAATAARKAAAQHDDMVRMITGSFRTTPGLDRITAIMTANGPENLMDRYGAVHGASVSMEHTYDQFVATRTAAQKAKAKATKARKSAERMAADAKSAAAAAAAADAAAQADNQRIAATRTRLVEELAAAQGVSVRVARQRQSALEARAASAAAAATKAQTPKPSTDAPAPSAPSPAQPPSSTPTPSKPSTQGPSPSQPSPLPGTTPPPGTPPPPSNPSPSGGAAAAIAFAKQQLGEPYKWGAAGPSSWDCSGLTMMAWKAGGKSLPHYSAGQYKAITHITRSQLQPGDLVFWGGSASSIHHVALYIGNGQILHAPRTGRPVAINSIDYWIPPNYFGRP